MFVSRPSELTVNDERAAQAWDAALVVIGMRPCRLTKPEYEDDAWTQLHRIIASVDGMIVLGFAGSSRSTVSPWLHIEASVALVVGTPVLVVPRHETVSEGIFDPASWTARLSGLPSKASPADGFPSAWVDAVHEHLRARIHTCSGGGPWWLSAAGYPAGQYTTEDLRTDARRQS